MTEPTQSETLPAVDGGFRCSECGDHSHLTAACNAVTFGPLNERGELASYDDVEDYYLAEDSIQCSEHPDAPLEKRVNGRWLRLVPCGTCAATGTVQSHYVDRRCPDCHGDRYVWGTK